MSKYQIYKNKRNRFHPSIEIEVDNNGNWFNYEITDSPRKEETYCLLNHNPNRKGDKTALCLVRKYLRKDKIRHRGLLLKHYILYPEDIELIENLLAEREINIVKNKKKNGVKRLNPKGNQANRRKCAETPSGSIKTHRRRKHKKKRK